MQPCTFADCGGCRWSDSRGAICFPVACLPTRGVLLASANPLPHSLAPAPLAGVTALYAAMHCPHVFGAVLAESPSLWIAEGRFLEEDLKRYRGPLPERIFIGCGACACIGSLAVGSCLVCGRSSTCRQRSILGCGLCAE